jgi:hypothetical protein
VIRRSRPASACGESRLGESVRYRRREEEGVQGCAKEKTMTVVSKFEPVTHEARSRCGRGDHWSNDPDNLARGQIEIDIMQDFRAIGPVAKGHVIKSDGAGHGGNRRAGSVIGC